MFNVGLRVAGISKRRSSVASLEAEWKMNEGTGTVAHDSSPSTNDLTITNGGWSGAVSPLTNMVTLSGTGNMESANNTNQNFDFNQPFSVSAWFEITTTSVEQTLVGHLDTASNFRGWELDLNGFASPASLTFLLISTYPSNLINVLLTGISNAVLYNVVVTYDGSATAAGVKVYLNGVLHATSVVNDTLSATTQNSIPIFLGARNDGTNKLTGEIGPTYIWDRVLTSSEAASVFSNPYTPPS